MLCVEYFSIICDLKLCILLSFQPAGILTRLQDGIPVVDGQSALNGINVGDVVGWAPTTDTLSIVKNKCNAENFLNYTLVAPPVPAGENANDVALRQLLNGTVDATWICEWYYSIHASCLVLYLDDHTFSSGVCLFMQLQMLIRLKITWTHAKLILFSRGIVVCGTSLEQTLLTFKLEFLTM